jgi:hypothetical protein
MNGMVEDEDEVKEPEWKGGYEPRAPLEPRAGGAELACPGQGDHVFGDVVGTIKTGLQKIFGNVEDLTGKITDANKLLGTTWAGMEQLDCGHINKKSEENILVIWRSPSNTAEIDIQNHMFGRYAERLHFALKNNDDSFTTWINNVTKCFGDLMDNIVDKTAFEYYIKGVNSIRSVSGKPVEKHTAMSLSDAKYALGQSLKWGGTTLSTIQTKKELINNVIINIDSLQDKFDFFCRRYKIWKTGGFGL